MIVYFSGTGNSRYCAQMLAHNLGDELLDCANYIRHQIAADLISGKPWVFVSPTYAWRLPRIFAEFIRSGSFSGSTDAYFVMTCGSDIGNAGAYMNELCREVGLQYRGVLQVVMPENYIAMFEVPAAEEAARIVEKALPTLEEGVACIRSEADFPPVKVDARGKLKSGSVNTVFYKKYVKAKDFYATDACVGCGKCEEACVLGNIVLKEGRPVWGDRCTHCMACICGCPAEANEYGKHSRNKPRYWCKDYLPE